jgi:alkylation response protein AidB-like acyl-CoA dehydrogenase
VSLDLEFDDGQQAVAEAVAAFCRERCPDDVVRASAGTLPLPLWRELADLGVLALCTPQGDGGALEWVAALESLGHFVFPGPLAATAFAGQCLPDAERDRVVSGEAIVSLGTPPLLPFAPVAQVFLETDGVRAWLARPEADVAAQATLGGEPWGRAALIRERELPDAVRAGVLHDLVLAAYGAAAGERLVEDAAEHARVRHQFGKPIGEFQAVAHPLADCQIALTAARTLARTAAFHWDANGWQAAAAWAGAARLSATRAGLQALRTAHQVFGALGITLEGPAFHVSRRIRQLASQPAVGAERNVLAPLHVDTAADPGAELRP